VDCRQGIRGVSVARSQRDVTEAELAILQVLWEEGTATVRRLIDRLYPPGGASAHATVQKLLERLEAKGCISRDRSGPVQVITPAISREAVVRRRLKDVANDLCGGSLAAMLSHLVNPRKLASKDRKALREFLQQLQDEETLRDDGDESQV
jgi:BlaI family transcriptional regulator, penicillinase repressor